MAKEFEKYGHPTAYLRRVLMKRQQGKCAGCGVNDWELDRCLDIHRTIKDGPYEPGNCTLLCRACHQPITSPRKNFKKKGVPQNTNNSYNQA